MNDFANIVVIEIDPGFEIGMGEAERVADLVQQQAVESYRKAIQTAFAEVETGLVNARKLGEQLGAQAHPRERGLQIVRHRREHAAALVGARPVAEPALGDHEHARRGGTQGSQGKPTDTREAQGQLQSHGELVQN